MTEVDFSDRESAKAWFEGQSVAVRCAIASRAALRVVANISAVEENTRHSLALAVLRSILTSSGRGMASTSYAKRVNWRDRTKASAEAAAFTRMKTNFAEVSDILTDSYQNPTKTAVYTTEHSAIRVAGFAVSVALAALSTSANSTAQATAQSTNAVAVAISAGGESIDALQAVRATAHAAVSWDSTQKSKDLYHHPVWAGSEVPDAIAENHLRFLTFLRSDPAWAFWLRFYEGMWEGTFDEWDLAFEVIQIDEAEWEKGYERIGEVIAGIEAELIAKTATIQEKLVLNEETLQYSAQILPSSNLERLKRHLSRIEDALDDIIALGGGNGVTQNTAEFRIIKRLVGKYSDDPERAAFDLTDVNKSIARQIVVGEYADDEPLRLLQAANTACVSFVCETQPEIAVELERTSTAELQVLSEQDTLILQHSWRISEDMLDDEATLTTIEDEAEILSGQIIDASVDSLPELLEKAHTMRAIVLRRQISRFWQQAQGLATIPALAEKYDEPHSKALGYVGRVGGAGATLCTAILILGKLMG